MCSGIRTFVRWPGGALKDEDKIDHQLPRDEIAAKLQTMTLDIIAETEIDKL